MGDTFTEMTDELYGVCKERLYDVAVGMKAVIQDARGFENERDAALAANAEVARDLDQERRANAILRRGIVGNGLISQYVIERLRNEKRAMRESRDAALDDLNEAVKAANLLKAERDRAIGLAHALENECAVLREMAGRKRGAPHPNPLPAGASRGERGYDLECLKKTQRGLQRANEALTEKLGEVQTTLTAIREELHEVTQERDDLARLAGSCVEAGLLEAGDDETPTEGARQADAPTDGQEQRPAPTGGDMGSLPGGPNVHVVLNCCWGGTQSGCTCTDCEAARAGKTMVRPDGTLIRG